MNNSNLEKEIARFKFKDAAPDLRERVLHAARTAMQETKQKNINYNANSVSRHWHFWNAFAGYAAAAVFLLILNGLVTSHNRREISALVPNKTVLDNTTTTIEQLYEEFGLDPVPIRQLRILAQSAKPMPDLNAFLQRKNEMMELL